jgi:hypothetical protein
VLSVAVIFVFLVGESFDRFDALICCLALAARRFRADEPQLHQPARRVIDKPSSVHGGPRFSNQACSEPSICTSSPTQSRRRRG